MTSKLLSEQAFSLVSDLETPAYDIQHLATIANSLWYSMWGARQDDKPDFNKQECEALLYALGKLAFKAHQLNAQLDSVLQAPAVQS